MENLEKSSIFVIFLAATKFMADRLQNKEILSHNDLHDLIEPMMYGNHSAKSAIDSALYDLIGKHQNKPIYEILGGKKREKAPMFWMVAGSKDEMCCARVRTSQVTIGVK